MDVGLVFILIAVFLASAFNTAFGFGGVFLLSGVLSLMLPITDVLPLQTALMVSSQLSRCVLLKSHIDWRFVRAFGIGSMIGAVPGALLYQQMSSDVITLMMAGFMLWSAWAPNTAPRTAPNMAPKTVPGTKFISTISFGNILTGAVHTFLSTAFSFGSLIQATLFRQGLSRTTVTATIALSMLVMSMFKIPAYAITGFDYSLYLPEIIIASLVAPFGVMVGKPLLLNMSERMFMTGFKSLLTVVASKLIWSVIGSRLFL